MSTVPVSKYVQINPGVVSVGGTNLKLNGLILTDNTRIPIGTVKEFLTYTDVSDYFGGTSTEYYWSKVYFGGFKNSPLKPGKLLMAQYPSAAVAGYLRGGSLANLTLTELKALSGTIILTVAGTVFTSSTITLTAATSFSDAATIIEAAFTTPTFAVTYDSQTSAFVFTTSTTGVLETITFATGTLATSLRLTSAEDAVLSQGSAAAVPADFMNNLVDITTNWAFFTTLFDPDAGSGMTNKLLFSAWAADQNYRYGYVGWDTDLTPTTSDNDDTCFGYIVKNTKVGSAYTYPNTAALWDSSALTTCSPAFVLGIAPSIDFTAVGGRFTYAFRSQDLLTASITKRSVADNLEANGYNYYNAVGNPSLNNELESWVFLNPGSISGPFKWLDSFINQIWMNNNFQYYLMQGLTDWGSVPYNEDGYTKIRNQLSIPIKEAVDFGAIRTGVSLSDEQKEEINGSAGKTITNQLYSEGYYLLIEDPGAIVRAARGTPKITFWYTDGQSVQKIVMNSLEVE
jgi:hypothetical protein